MVLEHTSAAVIGLEVKAAETVRAEDFRGLRHLANRLGDRFRAGIVLYAGEQQLSFGDRLSALPISALWTTAPWPTHGNPPACLPALASASNRRCGQPTLI